MNLSWTLRQVFERLFDDTETLADFLYAHEITIVHITAVANGNLEFKLVVIIIWKPLTNIVWDTGGTKHGTSETPVDRIFGGDCGDSFRPHFENFVVAIHLLNIVHIFRDAIEQSPRACHEIHRNVLGDTADTDIADRQTSSATRLDQIVDFLARAEPIPEIGDGAQIDQIRSDADEVIGNPAEFRENDADVLGALRYFYAEHLLDRHGVGDAVHHRRHVIQAIGEGNDLPVHLRIGVDDLFTVDSRLKPECPMHCRMLRSNVEYLRMRQSHGFHIFSGAFDDRQIEGVGAGSTLSRRKILSQRERIF